jgi:MFS transporter, DHA1 family, multidrug resistance protein
LAVVASKGARQDESREEALKKSLTFTLFFASAFAWNVGLGMSHMLIPLYANEIGFSGVAIGSLVALPVLLQIALNLLSGAWTDRVGGKRLAIFASAAMLGGSVIFAFAASFTLLFIGQLCFIVSRAVFWPATWTLGSHLPGDRSVQMGRLNSTTNAGQIVGTVCAGLAIAYLGFTAGFWLLAVLGGGLSVLLMALFTAPTHATPRTPQPMLAAYAALARRPSIWYGLMCAYVSALPFSLSVSFYPILLIDQGFSGDEAGWMLALRAVGSVCAGVGAARLVRRAAERSIPVTAAFTVAASVLFVAAFSHPVPISALLFLVGLGSGVMTLYFQLLISDLSTMQVRGSALALGGLGWGLSHLTTPLLMGALKDAYGIESAFYALGTIAVAWTVLLLPMHSWAFRDGRPR